MPAFPRNPFAPGGERFTIPHAFVLPGLNGQVWLSPKWQDILPPTIEFDPKRAIPPMPRQREKRGVETTRAPAQGVRDSGAKARPSGARKTRFRVARLVHLWHEKGDVHTIEQAARAYAQERLLVEFEHELRYEVSRK